MKSCCKIVLAYSGGLDTTVAIPWLRESTGAEVVALIVDVGQEDDLAAAVQRARDAGAVKALYADAKEEFAGRVLTRAIQANALYEGVYPLLSALSRPLIVERLVRTAEAEGAGAVAHGCTGKGNDQIRFELSLAALAPDLEVLAPARHWGMNREEEHAYARARGLALETAEGAMYSIDQNLWGRAVECGPLEDPWAEPPADAYEWTADPACAPDRPEEVTIEYHRGIPTAVNGVSMTRSALIRDLSKRAGRHGVGRIDHIENRTVGIKSREVYECPAAVPLIAAHRALEAVVLTKDTARFKAMVETRWAELVYEGKWHSSLKRSLDVFVESTQEVVTGSVRLKMLKGALQVVGRQSPYSLYDTKLTTYGAGDAFDHTAADGFLKIASLEPATVARLQSHAPPKTQEVGDGVAAVAEPIP